MSNRFDTTAIDAEIAALRRQRDALESKHDAVGPQPDNGPRIDWGAEHAQGVIDRKIQTLSEQRRKIMAGEAIEEPAAEPPKPAPKPPLTLRRMTKPDERKSIPIECVPPNAEQREILDRMAEKYSDADAIDRVEDHLHGLVGQFREKGLDQPVVFSRGLYGALVAYLASVWVSAEARAEYNALRRDELERRVATLEARPSVQYRGVWSEDQQNNEGDLVTHMGSMWSCLASATHAKPGASKDWVLAVKRGADGRDAR